MVRAMHDRCVMGLEAASSVRVHGAWEMSYNAMVTFSPLSQISDPVARQLLGAMLRNRRDWFNLWCTNEWQQSACWRGDGGGWEQKTSMSHYASEVLYTSCSGIASSSTMRSHLLYYFQNCPSPNPEIGNKHWKTNRTCLIWKVKEKENAYGIGGIGIT